MYVIWSLEVGGAERIVASLAKGMDRTLVSPMVVCLNHAGALAEELTQADIPVIALEKRGKIDLMLLWRLVRLMRRLRPDVVHTHLWGANAWGRVAARAAGVPVVIANEHSVDSWKPRFYLQLDRWLAPLTTRLVAVSQHVREFYEAQGIGRGRWQVIYNGIEIETLPERRRNGHYAALGIRSYEPVVGFIGRLVSARAPQVFVEAIQRARREIPSLRAVIVGDGPLRRDTEAYARRLGLERRVIFTGTRRDVPELLAGMDALVFSSEREGCSLAMLEAMACGVPVVATKVGGTLEVIEAGVSGLLVEPRQPQALADRIIEVLNTPSKAEAIRVAARQRVEAQFSLPRMIAEYQQLYLDVARPPRRSQEAGRGNRRHET